MIDITIKKLTSPQQFNNFNPAPLVNIFSLVIDGKLTTLASKIQGFPRDQVPSIINSMDEEGKTPLFYACYYNFQNIVMFLLIKGADPHIVSITGLTCYLVCAYKGHLECSIIIQQNISHISKKLLFEQMKQSMKKFGFKSSDVKGGCIVSLDRNLKTVQGRFQIFQSEIEGLFQAHVDGLKHQYDQMMSAQDQLGRSLVHWGAMSKYTNCLKTIQFLMMYSLKLDGWDCFIKVYNDVEQLEIFQELRVDPRHTQKATEIAINFLERSVQENIIFNMKQSVKAIMKTAVNQQENDSFTPMHLASFAGDFKAIQYFLSIGGNAHLRAMEKDVLDYAANDMVRKYMVDLKNAARDGDASRFNTLVHCGHKVDGRATIYGIGPLHHVMKHTAKTQSTDMFQTVMNTGPNLNLVDSNGWTPLHHAASVGNVSTVNSLIEHGAKVDRFSNKGYYPLHVAALYDKPDIIKALYKKSSNLENEDNLKCTALHLAARKGNSRSVQALIELGCNIYAQDIQKWTALHHAGFNNHKDVVNLLCRQDGDSDIDRLRQMKTSRDQLAFNLMPNETIRFSLETTWQSATNGKQDQLRRLLILGNKINEQTVEKKQTPLILKAAKNGHLTMVRFMLEKGADKTIRDKYDKTALDYAKEGKLIKIVQVLQEPNAK